jgi:hypothetical protein
MCRKALELIFCVLGIEKSDLDEFAYVMFQIGQWPYQLTICLLLLKINFADFDEAMFHDVERAFERIFYILGIEKSYLDEVAVVMF